MYWHLAAYGESIANLTNTDINAAADEVLTRRNNHLIFTEDYNLLAAWAYGTSLSAARFGNAALTQKSTNHIWPIDVSATVPDDPAVFDLRDAPMSLPQNEELTLEVTSTAVGPAPHGAILWLGLPEWNQNYPSAESRFTTRATATIVAASEVTWSDLAELTFERDLLNGVYAVIGAHVVAANALAFRFRFPDQPAIRGKQHRPGGLVQDTAALAPWPPQKGGFGEWGRFHTFTPPEVQVYADAAGGTYEIRLDLLYLGKNESLLRV